MEKTDQQIHKICIRNITKSLGDDAELRCTKIFFKNDELNINEVTLLPNEIPICSTIIDVNHWSLLTTQRLLTKKGDTIFIADIETANNRLYGDFKGVQGKAFTIGRIETSEGNELEYFIETGKSSMVMVQGIKTRVQIQNKS